VSEGEAGPEDAASGETDRPAIRALDDRTVRQIAAGEVVERPASVVKELVENSLDAGANRVSVAVDAGGTEGVRVRDDGVGMTEAGVEAAVREHTTSKIDDIEDVESGVGTLGFRGEALHTISAVSRTTIRTKPRGADGAGTELRVEGGEVTDVRPAGCPEGTVVEVDDLFYNTPARRKFLKTDATEFDHVNTVVTHYALANPDVAISLEHDDREVFATEGRGSLESTVLSVYGREVAESMVRVDHEVGSGPVDGVAGLVSHPETTRSTRDYLSTFVNDRYVTARVLREAVLDAYGGQLASDRYPFAVLFVDVPAEAVDVNVHPRKMEVRFDDESAVRATVEEAVESALLEEGLVRSTAPRGRSAPDEASVSPESPADEVRGGAGHSPQPSSSDGTRERTGPRLGDDSSPYGADAGRRPSGAAASQSPSVTESGDGKRGPEAENDDRGESDDGGQTDDPSVDDGASTGASRSNEQPSARSDPGSGTASPDSGPGSSPSDGTQASLGDGAETTDASPAAERRSSPATGASTSRDPSDRQSSQPTQTGVVGPTEQRSLDGEAATLEPGFDSLPSMRVLGQLHETYIVAETDEGLVLVDQHAADERVNYERLQAELDGDVTTQSLADAVELELTAREAALFEEYRDALARLGFHAGRTGERTVEVRTVPAVFASVLEPKLLRDVLTAFVGDSDEGGRRTVDAVADDLLSDLACHPSVTGNTSLTEGSVVDLLEALDDCENPYACPHGRPVVIEFDRDEIADRFERDYPGHGGRRAE
jgi:DNA mismatch repair protein MutL